METPFTPNHTYLVFDTETTGLPVDWKRPAKDTDNWPKIVQFAMSMHYPDGSKETFCELIKPHGGAMSHPISSGASRTHGISDEDCYRRGTDIRIALDLFCLWYSRTNAIVCHNKKFDLNVLKAEMHRHGIKPQKPEIKPISWCTMEATTDLVCIPSEWGYKWPSLQELHTFLFGHGFEGGHHAMKDVEATERCYRKLVQMDMFPNDYKTKFLPTQDV